MQSPWRDGRTRSARSRKRVESRLGLADSPESRSVATRMSIARPRQACRHVCQRFGNITVAVQVASLDEFGYCEATLGAFISSHGRQRVQSVLGGCVKVFTSRLMSAHGRRASGIAALGLSAVLLVGCGGGDEEDPTEAATEEATEAATEEATEAATEAVTGGASGSPTPAAGAAGSPTPVSGGAAATPGAGAATPVASPVATPVN